MKVLMIGPGKNVRGGITSVIAAYSKTDFWNEVNCDWLETYDDRGNFFKILAAFKAFFLAPFKMWNMDIIHIHSASNTSFYRKTIFIIIAKILRKKIILHLHAADDEAFFINPLFFVSKIVFSSVERVIVLSNSWAEIINKVAPKSNIVVISNPCTTQNLQISNSTTENIIIYAGKLEERKGFRDLINAMPLILSELPNAKLLMAGHGDLTGGKDLAKSLNVESSVNFLGWLNGNAKDNVFKSAKIFCLPSYDEGVPMAMLEAMGYGLPVVVTPVGGIPDVIEDHINGIFVTPGDSKAIAKEIIQLLKDENLCCLIRKNAWETVDKNFSLNSVVSTLINLYNNVLSQK